MLYFVILLNFLNRNGMKKLIKTLLLILYFGNEIKQKVSLNCMKED